MTATKRHRKMPTCSDDKAGWVALEIRTQKHKHGLQIYVTKTGKVRIHSDGGEWIAPNAQSVKTATSP
jgi:hypothetical protein